jgi:hypothetical protein
MIPELSANDWVEIYYALEYKLTSPAVQRDARYKRHLAKIMFIIGEDGEHMRGGK